MSETIELENCPFCGGQAQTDFIEGESYIIECYVCEARTGNSDGAEAAITAWNRRVLQGGREPGARADLRDRETSMDTGSAPGGEVGARQRGIDTFVGQPFAIVRGYHMDCERPALACFTGSEYEFADGDRYERKGDTLAGYPAEFLTLHQLEKRLAMAPDRIQIAIAALRAGLIACAETFGRRQADHVSAVHDKVIADGKARLSQHQDTNNGGPQ